MVSSDRAELPFHRAAHALVERLANGAEAWAIPWPSIYELLRVATHPNLFHPPTPLGDAVAGLESLAQSPPLEFLGEGPRHIGYLRRAVLGGQARGSLAHDAHIAALALEHGVTEFWTADRGFRRFPGLTVRNPFAGPAAG